MKQTTLSLLAATLLLSPALAVEDLGEIIVTSTTKLPQKIKNSTADVTVITAEDIEEKGYQSLPEVLNHEAGFSFASNGGIGQTSSLYLRGLGGSDVLVLMDGVAMTDYTQPSPSTAIAHIPLSNIKRIEILKGSQSGVWGAHASGGVINIVTQGAASDHGSITIKTGAHDTKGIGITLSKNGEQGGLYFAADSFKTDAISSSLPSDAENDGFESSNFHLKATLNPTSNSSVTYFMHKNHARTEYDSGSANDALSYTKSDTLLYGIDYGYQKDMLTIHALGSIFTSKRTYNDANWGISEFEGRSKHVALTANYDFSTLGQLTLGLDHTKIEGESTFMPKGGYSNDAIFANYTHTAEHLLGAKTTFNAVIRYDKFDTFDNKVTYRFGFKRACDAFEGLHTSANIYTGYKAPSIPQFSSPRDVALKPESIEGYALSIGYKKYLNLSYFHNKITDKIQATSTFPSKYFNDGDGITTSGIELSGEYAFGDSGFIAGYNWTHMLDREDATGKTLLRIPENSINAYLDYYFNEVSHIGLNAKYVSERRDLDYSSWPANDVMLKSYTTVDLTYNTKLNEHFNLSITAKNIFDKTYETAKGYSTEGRSIYATMEYRF